VKIFPSSPLKFKTGALKFKNEWRSEGKSSFFLKITSSKKCRLSDKHFVEEEDRAHTKEPDVKHIKPMSHKLKQWMPKQWSIYN
jgi:hypothetical protein